MGGFTPKCLARSLDKNSKHVVLLGLSGSGKTTVGRILARRMRRRFYDSDAIIEKQERMPINDIFREVGERHFRIVEQRVLHELLSRKTPIVLAAGGGAVSRAANRKLFQKKAIAIHLLASVSVLVARLADKSDRPLLSQRGTRTRGSLTKLLREQQRRRRRFYEEADVTVRTHQLTPSGIVAQIMKRLKA